jgi:hypothetical protein
MGDPAATLATLVRGRARPDGIAWLDEALAAAAAGDDLRLLFPAAARRVGRGGLDSPGATLTAATGDSIRLAAWRVDDAARVLLLLAAASHSPTRALRLAHDLYFAGDARERIGALRAVSFLPDAATSDAALPAVLDAVRMNQGEVVEAAILDNPYASRHLPQHEWRKAVLKAVFVGHSIRRVLALEARADAELASSLIDLASEREAATRAVPPEIWPVAALHPPPGLAAKLLGYLEHPSDEHRAAAAEALGRLLGRGDSRLRPFIADRAEREHSDTVRALLKQALS